MLVRPKNSGGEYVVPVPSPDFPCSPTPSEMIVTPNTTRTTSASGRTVYLSVEFMPVASGVCRGVVLMAAASEGWSNRFYVGPPRPVRLYFFGDFNGLPSASIGPTATITSRFGSRCFRATA